MKIQYNTDKTLDGDKRNQDYFSTQIAEELKRYDSHITRIKVHLSDEKGKKEGRKDILCLLEARIEGRKPIAVSNQAAAIELAVSGAITKLKSALEKIVGRIRN